MGTEHQNHTNIPLRPAAVTFSAPQNMMPFSSSEPTVGFEASAFKPSLPTDPQTTPPFLSPRPAGESEASRFRPIPPGGTNDPSMQLLQSSSAPPAGNFQGLPAPPFSSTTNVTSPQPTNMGRPVFAPPVNPSAGHILIHSQSQISSRPMRFPPQSANSVPFGMNVPHSPLDSSFSAPRANFQSSSPAMQSSYPAVLQPGFPNYPTKQPSKQDPPVHAAGFLVHQGDYVSHPPAASAPSLSNQGGYPLPPGAAASLSLYPRQQIQHSGTGPPTGPMQGLIEDFSSLSLGSVPGSFDPGLDSRALPRPLDGDVNPNSLAEMYPMNCNTRYLRLTTSAIPNSRSLGSRWHLPLGAVVCPLAEAPDGEELPIVNLATGIIRCRRCRAYVNPYVTFTDGGRKWRCNFCGLLNDVPGDYFAPLDASGRRVDLDGRPELSRGSVEYVAPTEYMFRPPMPPLYFFLIDVSITALRSGMLEVVAQTIKSCLDKLAVYSRTQIGFITFDSTIHFYNMMSSLAQPQMMVVSDLDDIFVPLPDDLLVNLSESRTVVDAFLDSLPSMFEGNANVESAFGPAVKAAYMVMSRLGGKLLIFQNTLPSLGVGRLRLRGDDIRVYGSDKEHALRVAEGPFYKQIAADFTKYHITVNVYAFGDKYTDVASLGTLAKYTGGQVYYYPSFHSSIHKDKLRNELGRDLTRETAWEAVMRLRCGKGVRFTTFHGNFMLRTNDSMSLPVVDCDKAYAAQFSLEDTLLTTQTVYFQVGLLYTSSHGERRIRVHTTAAPVVADLGELYRKADTGAILSLFSRLAIEKTLTHKLEEARNAVQLRIIKALREYRNLYAVQHHLGGRLIYPESLKFLPLYALALCKSDPLRGGYADTQLDEHCAAGCTMMALPVKRLLKRLYPNLIRIDEYLMEADDLKNAQIRLPPAAESLDPKGLYVYDDGFKIVLWFGRELSPDIAMKLLGEDCATDNTKVSLSDGDNEMLRKLMRLLKKFRESDPSYYQLCHIVRQGDQPREGFFLLGNLVEDKVGGMNGYLDWILQIHRQVQQTS